MVVLMIAVLPIYWRIKHEMNFVFKQQSVLLFCCVILVMSVPTIAIFLNYYFENRNISFSLDWKTKQVSINQNGITKSYEKEDIEKSTYHLGIYYKNAIDGAGRLPIMISDFGYWELEFKNGDKYYLTSILHDFIHDQPFFKNTKYRFRMFTYVNKSDSKEAVELKRIKGQYATKTRKERLREIYKQKSISELEYIVENEKLYMANARKVASELIQERKTLGNNV